MIKPKALEQALEAQGWQIRQERAFTYASKRIAGLAPAGQLAPDGGRIVTLRIDPIGALQRIGPWGEIEAHCSLFTAPSASAAIAAALPAQSG